MKRKSHVVACVALLLALLLAPVIELWSLPAAPTAAAQTATRPSILVIQTDDMRLDDLLAMPKTVALLGGGGLRFAHYLAGGTPLCCPNRATALTGLYPHNHGVLTNDAPAGGHSAFERYGNESRSINVALHAAGYKTAYLGKYMNGYPAGRQNGRRPPGWNNWHAFIMDKSCRACSGGTPRFYYNYQLNQNGRIRSYGSKKRDYSTNHLTRLAISIIQSTPSTTPLFLWVNPFAPHTPAIPAPNHKRRPVPLQHMTPAYNTIGTGKAAWMNRLPVMNQKVRAYIERANRDRRRTLVSVDDMVAKLIAAMPSGSYVFFFSDNGYMLGDLRIPLGKFVPYRASVEAPLLVAGPGVAPNSVSQDLVSSIDLAPTWAEIGGATMPGPVDGVSLLPVLQGGDLVPRDSVLVSWLGSSAGSLEADLDGDVLPVSVRRSGSGPAADTVQAERKRAKPGKRKGKPKRKRKRRRSAVVTQGAYLPPPYNALRGADWLYIEWADGHKEYYDHATQPYELENGYEALSETRQEELADRVRALRTCSGEECTIAGP